MKKLLSVILVIIMICSTFAGLQISSSALEPTGRCGENVYWSFEESTGTLTISGEGNMYNYNRDSPLCYDDDIVNIIIENGVTSIGASAFYDCSNLTSINIPNFVTSIGDHAFVGCSSLESITIPNSVKSIGESAFTSCSSLKSITIPDSVITIGEQAFWSCSELTSITIPDSVITISDRVFERCSSLESITIPNSVTRIGESAFTDCSSLTIVTIGNSVESIGKNAFYGCSGLTSIKVGSGNTVYDSRNNCNAVIERETNKLILGCKNTVIPDTVEAIDSYAFRSCSGLTSITIPASVYSIGYYAFYGCTKLKELIIPYSVIFIGGSVKLGATIEKLYFNDEPTEITDKFNPIFKIEKLKEFEVPNSVNYIGDAAFKDCKNLTSITVPKSVTRIEYNAFSGCTNLTIKGYKDSYAETFCKWAGIPLEVIEEPHTHDFKAVINAPKTNALGYTQYKCECGEFKKDEAGNIIKDNFTAPTGKPAGFKCASRTATAEKFTWTKTSGVNGYQVQLLNSAGKNAGTVTTTGNAYTFAKLAAGHAYKARVRFYIKAADGKNYYSAWATINSPTLPAGTSLVKVTVAKKAFTAQWKKGAVTGYQLQYSTNNKFTSAKTVTIKKVGTLKYTISKLAAKKTYYVRVRTYKTMNKVNYYSAWSAAKAVKTK